ncbi:MAG TPA: non-canonical purine NTP pyrophosphatase, partial [Armatimonadetes bacterium]|nr:non-canonical purine NTP pyrophosphatase [Armatimonadota bacterium]
GKTMAELEPWEKNLISHRARALEAAKNVLSQLISKEEAPGK